MIAPADSERTTEDKTVGMGQIALGPPPVCLTAVLGSCIGITLYHKRLRLAALAHVILPHGGRHGENPGKFSNTAVPQMLELLKQHGAAPGELVAKIIGGACMFSSGGPMHLGSDNVNAASRALELAGVPLVATDVGGNIGRRVSLDCNTGLVTVEGIGRPPRTA